MATATKKAPAKKAAAKKSAPEAAKASEKSAFIHVAGRHSQVQH